MIKVFRKNLDAYFTFQFSVRLFFRACRRHITAFFVRERSDLLDGVIETNDLELDIRVADEFAIRKRRRRNLNRVRSRFFSGRNV